MDGRQLSLGCKKFMHPLQSPLTSPPSHTRLYTPPPCCSSYFYFGGGPLNRDQCLGKIEVPLSKVKDAVEPADMVMSLLPTDDAAEPASGDLRVTVQLK